MHCHAHLASQLGVATKAVVQPALLVLPQPADTAAHLSLVHLGPQISFKETLDQYRKMPQARSHIYRRVPLLQDAGAQHSVHKSEGFLLSDVTTLTTAPCYCSLTLPSVTVTGNLSLLLACQPGCLFIALVEKPQGLCRKLAASGLRHVLHLVLPSARVPPVLSTHPAVLRPLSTGDIIGFYNTIIIPAAKDYLHAMVDGKTPLHPPPGLRCFLAVGLLRCLELRLSCLKGSG
jgi:Retinoblastoma-associated protein B domain